ncbi:MAG: hypothetical protein IIY32_03870, partial [Thermoguttaceae bacterium]|nr:hypothetical protein [Thermoguttaceae bacterium]
PTCNGNYSLQKRRRKRKSEKRKIFRLILQSVDGRGRETTPRGPRFHVESLEVGPFKTFPRIFRRVKNRKKSRNSLKKTCNTESAPA